MIRYLRDFALRWMAIFCFLAVLRGHGVISVLAIVIVSFMFQGSVIGQHLQPPHPRRFLVLTAWRMIDFCLAWTVCGGFLCWLTHDSVDVHALWANSLANLPDRVTLVVFVGWWFVSAWWMTYVPEKAASGRNGQPQASGEFNIQANRASGIRVSRG